MSKENYFNAVEFDTIRDVIYDTVKKHSNHAAFVIKETKGDKTTYNDISYTKLLEDLNALGTAMYSIGMEKKRIAVIGKNRYEWVLTHYSSVMGSNISVPLDKDLQLEELENSLVRSKASAIVFDKKLEPIIKDIKFRRNTFVEEFISMDDLEGYTSFSGLLEKGYELIKNGNTKYMDTKIDPDEMAILLFTSGTTSQSKAVMLSNRNVASNVFALQCVEDIRPTDTNIAFLPFHHIFGSTCLALMLACGVKTAFPDGLRYIKQNLVEYHVSIFVGVPVLTEAMYKALLKEVDKQGKTKLIKIATKVSNFLLKLHIDVRRKLFKQVLDGLGGALRLVISGGAPADPVSIKGFNELGIITLQGYGLTETAPVVAAESFKHRKIGSIGHPMPNVEVDVINKDEDGIGELVVKGPSVMLGYYEMDELTNEVIKDGWFHTGDLGYIDKDGFVFITGRNKNLIVLKNGKKVFPEELETMVNRIDLVSESMVFGLKDERDEQDVVVSVKVALDEEVIKEQYKDKTDEELKDILWEKIKEVNLTFPKYKHIKKLLVTHEELIKTTTKKVKRQEEMKKIEEELAK